MWLCNIYDVKSCFLAVCILLKTNKNITFNSKCSNKIIQAVLQELRLTRATKLSRSLSRKRFSSGCSRRVYSEFHHCSWISQAASLFPGTTFTPTSRGELALFGLCQVQVSVYSPSLFCCADSRGGEREPSFMLPRLCLHRQRGQSHNLISSSANNIEPSETALMSEHIRMKRETADESRKGKGCENEPRRKEGKYICFCVFFCLFCGGVFLCFFQKYGLKTASSVALCPATQLLAFSLCYSGAAQFLVQVISFSLLFFNPSDVKWPAKSQLREESVKEHHAEHELIISLNWRFCLQKEVWFQFRATGATRLAFG